MLPPLPPAAVSLDAAVVAAGTTAAADCHTSKLTNITDGIHTASFFALLFLQRWRHQLPPYASTRSKITRPRMHVPCHFSKGVVYTEHGWPSCIQRLSCLWVFSTTESAYEHQGRDHQEVDRSRLGLLQVMKTSNPWASQLSQDKSKDSSGQSERTATPRQKEGQETWGESSNPLGEPRSPLARGLRGVADSCNQNRLQADFMPFKKLPTTPLSCSKEDSRVNFGLDGRTTSICWGICLPKTHRPPQCHRVPD
jgi:hypothetical protein